jgi:TonB family protein
MKRTRAWFAAVLIASMFGGGTCLLAQKASTDESKRKVKTRVEPRYPELARRMNVSGKVKIEVVVSPEGRVRKTRVIGGHPLLVNPSVEAVKEWRFVPASEETTLVVEFEFVGSNGN